METLLKYKRHIPFLVLLAIISLVMARNDAPKRPVAGQWVALRPAWAAPAADMLLADGTRTTLAAYRGKVVLLNIWATWCTPCIHELPTLVALQQQKGDRLVVLTLNIDRVPIDQLQAFVQEKAGVRLPHLAQDDTGALFREIGTQGLPITYLIDREGALTHRFIGAVDWTNGALLAPVDAVLGE